MSATLFQNKPTETTIENNFRRSFFRWFRILFGAGLITYAGYLLWHRQTRVISRVGHINAELITIYAPITGTLHLEQIDVGKVLPKGSLIGSITNERNPQLVTDLENLRSRLQLAQNQLKSVNERLNTRQRLASFLTKKTANQTTLDIDFFRANVERTRNELRQAQANLELASKEAQRFTRLAQEGAVSEQRADQAMAEMKAAEALVASRQAELDQSLSALTATRQGLQLDSARTFSFPQARLLDLQKEIIDLMQEKRQFEVSILTLQQEIRNLQRQLNLHRKVKLESPIKSVVWSVNIRTGELGVPVSDGTAIMQLLNCKELWASALVHERANRRLHLGQPAEVRLLDGSNKIYRGWVRSIRGGVGRVRAGSDLAVPPDDLVRHELEVHVTLDSGAEALAEGRFCSVGQNVEVIFF